MREKSYQPVISIMLVIKRVTKTISINNNKGIIWGGMTLSKVLLGLGGFDPNIKNILVFNMPMNDNFLLIYFLCYVMFLNSIWFYFC